MEAAPAEKEDGASLDGYVDLPPAIPCTPITLPVWLSRVCVADLIQARSTPNIEEAKSLLGKLAKVEVVDGRYFIGKLYCIDHKMSIILSQCVEHRQVCISDGTKSSPCFVLFLTITQILANLKRRIDM